MVCNFCYPCTVYTRHGSLNKVLGISVLVTLVTSLYPLYNLERHVKFATKFITLRSTFSARLHNRAFYHKIPPNLVLFLYNWSEDDLYWRSKLAARQRTITKSVLCDWKHRHALWMLHRQGCSLWRQKLVRLHKGVQLFPKSRSHLKILGATGVTQVPCWGPTNIRRQRTKISPCRPDIPALTPIQTYVQIQAYFSKDGVLDVHTWVWCCSIYPN